MRRWIACFVVMLVSGAGCMMPMPYTDDAKACAVRSPRANDWAPPLPALDGPWREVADRVARAVGHWLAGEPSVGYFGPTPVVTWPTDKGELSIYERVGFGSTITVTGVDTGVNEARWFLDLVEALGLPDRSPYTPQPGAVEGGWSWVPNVNRSKPNDGAIVHFLEQGGILRLQGLSDAAVRGHVVDPADARAIGRAYMRCRLDADGWTEDRGYVLLPAEGSPQLTGWDGALAWRIQARFDSPLEGSRCTPGHSQFVLVDAQSADVLAAPGFYCP